jgi:N6-L-threonylcarbamoyladenine synthase
LSRPATRAEHDAALVLGIETSCDETAAAVVRGGREVLSNIVASQHTLHAEYQGVVPEIASRAHAERVLPVVREAIKAAGITLEQINAVAVGHRPGLIGSLLVGVSAAKALAWSLDVPLAGVDHIHAHMYAGLLTDGGHAGEPTPGFEHLFPALGLVISGGHTSIYRLESPTHLTRLGGTIDDAVGEAYDKVGALLGLPFPGGPAVDARAQQGNDRAFNFPISRLGRGSLDFSFSGLKTAVRYAVQGVPGAETPPPPRTDQLVRDICASFQRAAVGALLMKLDDAISGSPDGFTGYRAILAGGGVTANSRLRTELHEFAKKSNLELRIPAVSFCIDNAAMLAGLGQVILAERNWRSDPLSLTASPNTSF